MPASILGLTTSAASSTGNNNVNVDEDSDGKSSSAAEARAVQVAKNEAFAAAILTCLSVGFIYGFSIFSKRLSTLTGLAPADTVILGVLSQAGLGVFQYPTSLVVNRLQRRGLSNERLDLYLCVWSAIVYVVAMAGIGGFLYQCEHSEEPPAKGTAMGLLCIFFLCWGYGSGATMNACSTIINFNNQSDVRRKRRDLVLLSSAIGAGGVLIVIVYYFGLVVIPLSNFFFILMCIYILLTAVRIKWLVRIKHKVISPSVRAPPPPQPQVLNPSTAQSRVSTDQDDELESQPSAVSNVVERIEPMPLGKLFRNEFVLLTYLGTFLGIGVGGTVMSSLGNIGPKITDEHDLTFPLTITFLVMQTTGRVINAIVYGWGDWAYIFAFWHVFCLSGICSFLIRPDEVGAYISAVFVGMSFGGFHSSFPIIVATVFPGHPAIDYSQSFGLALASSSVGCIVVGQLSTVVYNANSLEDLLEATGFMGMFLFFMSLLVVSTLSAVVLGRKIMAKKRKFVSALDETPASSTMDHHDDRSSMVSAASFATLLREQDKHMIEMERTRTASYVAEVALV